MPPVWYLRRRSHLPPLQRGGPRVTVALAVPAPRALVHQTAWRGVGRPAARSRDTARGRFMLFGLPQFAEQFPLLVRQHLFQGLLLLLVQAVDLAPQVVLALLVVLLDSVDGLHLGGGQAQPLVVGR